MLHPVREPRLIVDDDGVLGQRAAQRGDRRRDVRGETRSRVLAQSGEPCAVPAGRRSAVAECLEQTREPVARVADHGDLRLERAADHGGIEIEVHERLSWGEAHAELLERAMPELRPDRKHDIGGL